MIEINIKKSLMGQKGKMLLNLDLKIQQKQITAIYGPSGAGKTTLLKILSGLIMPEEGEIIINGKTWLDTKRNFSLSPRLRKVAYVFQDYALFPNMSVKENIQFAAEKNVKASEIQTLIKTFELDELKDKKPHQLSGGQQQRVALARALIQKPNLLLLDEPLAALDNEIRYRLQDFLLEIQREHKLSTFIVSHDIPEIHKLSKTVLHIENGKAINYGNPIEVFSKEMKSKDLSLYGKIVEIDTINRQISILVYQELITINVEENQLTNYKIGQLILLKIDVNTIMLP